MVVEACQLDKEQLGSVGSGLPTTQESEVIMGGKPCNSHTCACYADKIIRPYHTVWHQLIIISLYDKKKKTKTLV